MLILEIIYKVCDVATVSTMSLHGYFSEHGQCQAIVTNHEADCGRFWVATAYSGDSDIIHVMAPGFVGFATTQFELIGITLRVLNGKVTWDIGLYLIYPDYFLYKSAWVSVMD